MKKERLNVLFMTKFKWLIFTIFIVNGALFLGGCYVINYSLAALESSLGEKFLAKGEYEKAELHFRKVLSLDPLGPFSERALFLLGKLYEEKKDYNQSIFFYKKVILLPHPYNYKDKARLALARVYLKKGEVFLAQDYLKEISVEGLTAKEKEEKKKLLAEIALLYKKDPEWENLKVLYEAYKQAYNNYIKTLLSMATGTTGALDKIFELREIFERKKSEYEKELKKMKRKLSLAKAKEDYLKAFEEYKSYLKKQGKIPDYEKEKFDAMFQSLQQKYLRYQMLLYGISVEINGK